MRKLLIHLFLCSGLAGASAQQVPLLISGKDAYKQVAGRYGYNEGLCLFDDGTFLLYGYATAIFGHYYFEKDYLLFYPDKPELFEVYATNNKSIGKDVKINFVNFEGNGRTFFQPGKDSVRQVFNDGANCFDAPFVVQESKIPAAFTLSAEVPDHEHSPAANAYYYENTGLYNDFMIVYYPAKRVYEPFSASFYKEEGKVLLRLSNFVTAKGYYKNEADEAESKQWAEVLEMKMQYDAEREMIKERVFANKHYHTFLPDSQAYDFDPARNLYVSKDAADNEAYFRQNPYNDDRYLRRFVLILPKAKSKLDTSGLPLANASIFYTVCGAGSEHAYQYKALDAGYENKETIPETIAAPPLLQQENKD